MDPIYLDNNATTAIHPLVAEEMSRCRAEAWANPASQHGFGRRARRLVEEARDGIVELLGGSTRGMASDRLIFTSGGTESNNLAIRGLGDPDRPRVILSRIEHPSALAAAECLRNNGVDVDFVPVDDQGVVLVDRFRAAISRGTRLAVVMLGNNETGVMQPISCLADICREQGVLFYSDAVQAVGKIPVSFAALQVDAMGFAAHKFHGPAGIGGLLLRSGVELRPLLVGGFQQFGLRPGTEPVALVAGMHAALKLWHQDSRENEARLVRLRDRLRDRLKAGFPQIVVNSASAMRLPHTLSVAFPGLDRQALVMALDMVGVACSTGSACASGSSEPSAVLAAMDVPAAILTSSIRLSLSRLTTEEQVDQAASRILNVVNELLRRNAARASLPTPRGRTAKSL